jgi:hypothetical protein
VLAGFLEPLGATVVRVPTTKVLHLNERGDRAADGSRDRYPPLVDDPAAVDEFLAVPEAAGAHVVLLGQDRDGKHRLADGGRRTPQRRAVRRVGLPARVDRHSEFEKLEGCVTHCLRSGYAADRSVAARGDPVACEVQFLPRAAVTTASSPPSATTTCPVT